MSGDYDDFLTYDNAMIAEIRPLAEEFIDVVIQQIGAKATPLTSGTA